MKTAYCVLFLSLLVRFSCAQAQDPVTWSATYHRIGDKEGEIVIAGALQKGWHTYSMRPTDAGPIPTSFTLSPSKDYSLAGKPAESGATEEFDKAFDAKLFVFHEKAELRQKIRLKGTAAFSLTVKVEYMSCNDMMCLPPKTATLQVKVQ